jgi:hypothetical protein
MESKCILTIVNIEYIEIFKKFLHFYEKNSSFDLIVITLNFDYSNQSTSKIKYIPYFDKNIHEFESTGDNFYIKNFGDKYKYIAGLKPKLVNFSLLLDYDLFFYIDADCLIMPNFDNYFNKHNNVLTGFPLCPNFCHDFMIYNGIGNPYEKENEYNEDLCLENPLIKFLNLNCKRTKYRNTFCFIYDKSCVKFFEEANKIIFEMDLFKNRNTYFPLLDETVFNVLFWKNNYRNSLNVFPCVDFYTAFKNNIEVFRKFRNKDKLALIHAKFYKTFFDADKLIDFKNIDEEKYQLIEKYYDEELFVNLFYYSKIKANEFYISFTVLNSEKLSSRATSSYSYDAYQRECEFFAQNYSYFVSFIREKDEKFHLIFKDTDDNILYYIDEAFNS